MKEHQNTLKQKKGSKRESFPLIIIMKLLGLLPLNLPITENPVIFHNTKTFSWGQALAQIAGCLTAMATNLLGISEDGDFYKRSLPINQLKDANISLSQRIFAYKYTPSRKKLTFIMMWIYGQLHNPPSIFNLQLCFLRTFLNVADKIAWYMLHKIRTCYQNPPINNGNCKQKQRLSCCHLRLYHDGTSQMSRWNDQFEKRIQWSKIFGTFNGCRMITLFMCQWILVTCKIESRVNSAFTDLNAALKWEIHLLHVEKFQL